jgi:hypothetical protein
MKNPTRLLQVVLLDILVSSSMPRILYTIHIPLEANLVRTDSKSLATTADHGSDVTAQETLLLEEG